MNGDHHKRAEALPASDATVRAADGPRQDRENIDYLQMQAAGSRGAPSAVQLLVDACPLGMLLLGDGASIVLANDAAARTFGYARHELIGKPFDLLVLEQRALAGKRGSSRVRTEPGALDFGSERSGRHRTGAELQLEVSIERVALNDREYELAVVVDIGARKQALRAARELHYELERSNAELDAFANVAAHDLREPLRGVVHSAETLAERCGGALDVTSDLLVRQIVEGGKRMKRLIDDLLVHGRVRDGEQPLVTVNMETVLSFALAALRSAIADTSATIVSGAMPLVLGDEIQLARLLQNLIHNAIKFRSQRPARVRITSEQDGELWRFAVEDNGIGIARAEHQRVFQMFQRLHPRAAYDGGGLGLAIAKRIVERHGGTIWLDSEPGRGTTFHFTLKTSPASRSAV